MKELENWDNLRNKIVGLGNFSSRKSYFPELQQKLSHLERFRALLDKTEDGIIEAEAENGLIIEANQAAASILSSSKENLLGNSIYAFFDSNVSDKIKDLQKITPPGENASIAIETMINLPDGIYRFIELSIQISFFGSWNYLVIIASDITERIKAQEQLRNSELNLRSIFDSTYDAILIHNELGKIMEVNSAMLSTFEITKEQSVGLDVSALSATVEQLDTLPGLWKKTLDGEPVVFEWKALRPVTRTTFIAEVALKKVIWNGEAAIVAVVRDITSRKQVENDLVQANRFNNEIISGAGQGIIVYDSDFCYQLWNPFMEKITGIQASDILGKNALSSFPHIKKNGIDLILQGILNGEKETSLEFDYFLPQNGRKGWLEATYVPHHNNEGKVIGIIGTMRDITERKMAENALRSREALLHTLIENAPFEIWARNKDSVGILENKKIVKHFGSILGKKPESSPVIMQNYNLWVSNNKKALNGTIVDSECDYVVNGKKRYYQQIVAPIYNNGLVDGIAGFNIDITKRKLDELEIIRANRVYALTSKISQMIIDAKDPDTIFSEACNIAIEYGHFRMAWIGLVKDGSTVIQPVTWAGHEEGYLEAIKEITIKNKLQGKGPTGSSIRTGKPFSSTDITKDAIMVPWRDEALKRGYRSSAAFPIKVDGEILGAFTLYAAEPSFFNNSEIKLLEEVTNNIGFALEKIEAEKEKQKAQDDFLKEKLFTDAVIDSIPGLLYLYDAEGNLKRWNKKHLEITGYSADELNNFFVLDWYRDNPEDCEKIKAEIKKTLEEGYSAAEAKLTTKDGRKISFYFTAVKLVIDEKIYFTGIGIDITDRKKALEEIIYNEQRLRVLSEASFEGILFSENGVIFDINEQLLKIIGYNREEVIGHQIIEFVKEESRGNVKEKILKNDEDAYELLVIRKDGTTIVIESRARTMLTDNRKIRVSVIRDITERKRLEKELLNSVINTEEKERLNFSQELHDGLGPLLSAAKIYVQWLERPDTKADKNETIRDIDKLLDEAIYSIREISFKLSPHILQNYGLLEALKAFLAKIKNNYHIALELHAEEIPRINELAETIIYRILCECINNTLKHAAATCIRIFIEKTDDIIFVFYSDNGRGFNVEEKLMDKQGVGLMNMRSRLNSINGKINFQSCPEHGTDIYMKIILPDMID